MSVSEFQRHEIFKWFEEAMGPERAAVMMDLLPPVGWGDVATKTDLAILEGRLRGEMHHEIGRLLHTLFIGMVASNATLVGLVLAAVKLG